MKVVMMQHTTPKTMDFHGFTVKPRMFFGYIHLFHGIKIPCAWSGWYVEGSIALYVLMDGEWVLHWVNEDEVPREMLSLVYDDIQEWEWDEEWEENRNNPYFLVP